MGFFNRSLTTNQQTNTSVCVCLFISNFDSLAFAIIMLNTDLHTPALKRSRRMKLDEFVRNVTGTADCRQLDRRMLAAVYERVRDAEFRTAVIFAQEQWRKI